MDFSPDFLDGMAGIVTAAIVWVAVFLARLLGLTIQAKHRAVLDAAVRTAALALLPRLLETLADVPLADKDLDGRPGTTREERRRQRAMLATGRLAPANPDVRAAVAYVRTDGAPVALKALVGTNEAKQREVIMEKLTAAVAAEVKPQ